MKNIADAIVHTPWWVFPLLGYLIVIGIQSRRTRIVSIYKLFVIPVIFLVISLIALVSAMPDFIVLSCWLAAILAGSAIGFFQLAHMEIKVDVPGRLIQIPGSWSNLVVMLLIFASRYYFGYDMAVNPAHNDLLEYKIIRTVSSGLLTGYLQGKLLGYLYHFKKEARSSIQAGLLQ
jgi:hypothetical protein